MRKYTQEVALILLQTHTCKRATGYEPHGSSSGTASCPPALWLTETVFLSIGFDLNVRVTVRSMSFMGVPVEPLSRYLTR